MSRWLRSLFAWRDVRDTGVWLYRENSITGERCVMRSSAGGYQPVDQLWLDGLDGLPLSWTPTPSQRKLRYEE